MSFSFLAQPDDNAIAIVRHGTSDAFDEAAITLCKARLEHSNGEPISDADLLFHFTASKNTPRSATAVVGIYRILLGFDISPTQLNTPEDIEPQPEKLKGIVFYKHLGRGRYRIDFLCTSEDYGHRGMATHLIRAALQSIQDECIIIRLNAVTINLNCAKDKVGLYTRNEFAIAGEKNGEYEMERIVRADDQLFSRWISRKIAPVGSLRISDFPSRTINGNNSSGLAKPSAT